jgi:glycosyltransferase involved in cell wall biosynthesis
MKLEYRLEHAETVEADDVLGDGETRYIFNLSSSNHWRSHPVGIIRVEREIATYLRRFRNVDYALWDAQAQCLKLLGRIHADRILAPGWCDPEAALIPYNPTHMREASIRPNDIYISMGLDWDHAPTSHVLKYLKRLGAKSILTCFDTVPVQFPEFLVRDEIGQQFRQHLIEMAHGADKVWAISQATGKDLAEFWQNAHIERGLPKIFSVPLASYTDTSRLPTLDSRDHAIMRDVFSKGDYVLYVSSVEPRKNHKLMFDIWRDLWNERGEDCPQFVFVGAVGWGCGDTTQRVSRMAAYTGGKINGLHQVSDDLLQHLYNNSSFTVFPSLYEGWGLAATEAMQHGKVCVVANSSSLVEATQGLMPSFHPLDFPAWKAEIERLLDDLAYRRSLEDVISKQYKPLTWNDIGERLCQELVLGHCK